VVSFVWDFIDGICQKDNCHFFATFNSVISNITSSLPSNMKQEKYNRYEFLKKMGFQGGALMAVLASCTQQEDSVLESLIVNKNGETVGSLDSTKSSSSSASTGTTGGGTTTGGTTNGGTTSGGTTTGGTTSTALPLGKVTTAELSNVKNPLVKVDLTSSAASPLNNTGGYILANSNSIVIGRAASGDYVAATTTCTHEPKRQVIFNKTEYFCTAHGARFSLTGATLNTVARSPISVYKTANDGKTLIVYA
jgi:nitrite reductase/ring-hydroxylating ferredoxin subunit